MEGSSAPSDAPSCPKAFGSPPPIRRPSMNAYLTLDFDPPFNMGSPPARADRRYRLFFKKLKNSESLVKISVTSSSKLLRYVSSVFMNW
jgi:hypothetical protein